MSDIFTPKDNEILDKMSDIRQQAILMLSKDKLPSNPEELALLVHITDVETKGILQKARVKASDKSAQALAGVGYSMAELLKRTHNKPTAAQRTQIPTLEKDDVPTDVVPGETSMGYNPIDPDEISL